MSDPVSRFPYRTGLVVLALAAASVAGVSAFSRTGAEDAAPRQASAGNNASLRTVDIPVEGMVCLSCAATIKETLKELEGVRNVEAVFVQRYFRVSYPAGRADVPGRVVAAINNLGYKAGAPVAQ